MNIDILRSELAAGHPDTGAYDADPASAAAQLNAVNRTRLRPLTVTQLREWAALSARGFKLRRGIDDTNLTDQQRNLCLIADKLLGTDDGNLDPSNAEHRAFIEELVAAGVLNIADKSALAVKATDRVSRAGELGLGTVRPGHVIEARV